MPHANETSDAKAHTPGKWKNYYNWEKQKINFQITCPRMPGPKLIHNIQLKEQLRC